MGFLKWLGIIIGFILAIIIVNTAQRLYMKLLGAEFMLFSGRKKLIAIVVVGLFLSAMFWRWFGVA